jgi:hypothetical protein
MPQMKQIKATIGEHYPQTPPARSLAEGTRFADRLDFVSGFHANGRIPADIGRSPKNRP